MEIKNIKEYEDWKALNTDEYGACVFRYVERWSEMMEKEIKKGAKIENIADKLSHDADTEGITGFMYGCAVDILTKCWVYGEELRKWHNNEYNYQGEGVVNPAILTINQND